MDYRTKTECYSLILVKLDLIFWKKGFTEFFVAYLVSLASCSAGFSGTGWGGGTQLIRATYCSAK